MSIEITPEAADFLVRACKTHLARLAQKARRHQRIIDKYEAGAIPPPDCKETDPDKILAEARRRLAAKERAIIFGDNLIYQLETMQRLQPSEL